MLMKYLPQNKQRANLQHCLGCIVGLRNLKMWLYLNLKLHVLGNLESIPKVYCLSPLVPKCMQLDKENHARKIPHYGTSYHLFLDST